MIVTMFPEPREQAKAIGIYGFVASGGGSVGLLAGGALTDAISWHWIFFINLPIGVATYVAARRLIADDRGLGLHEGADAPGAVLVTGALMLGVYTIVGIEQHGFASARTLVLGAVSVALLAAFIARQATAAKPLMPLRLFRSRNVSGANAIQVLAVAGMFGLFFLGALYLQKVLRYDPVDVGLAFLPATVTMGVLSVRYSARLSARFGALRTMVPGFVLIVVSLAWFARVPVDGSYWVDVLPSMLLLGTGAGVAFPTLMMVAMSGATPEDAGLASGLVNTTAQVGGAIGLAVLATAAAGRSDGLRADGAAEAAALTGGYQVALIVAAALMAVAVVILATVIREPKPAPVAGPALGDRLCPEAA
jgi:MFS family permease